MDKLQDMLHPTARSYLALAAGFGTATVLRSACFNPRLPIFGPDLQKNLAPLERDDVSWSWIAAVRLWDLVLAIYVWHREARGHKHRVDAPLLGILLQLISRVPLYFLLHHHFLLNAQTLWQILITDVFAASAALLVISKIQPKAPAFFASPSADSPIRSADRFRLEMAAYAIGLATTVNALWSYVAERWFVQDLIRKNVLDLQMPAYLSAMKPALAEAMKHPTIAIPVLRSAVTPQSMPAHLMRSLPLSILILALSMLYLPQKSPSAIAGLVFLLVAPGNALSVFNLLPIKSLASAIIGIDNGLKAAVAAYIVAWATEDWRRPGCVARQAVLKEIEQGGDVTIIEKDSVTFRRELPAPVETDTDVVQEPGVEIIEEVIEEEIIPA